MSELVEEEVRESIRRPIPDPYSIPLEKIDMIQPHLFKENRIWEYFERLRAEDPVHFNEKQPFGRWPS